MTTTSVPTVPTQLPDPQPPFLTSVLSVPIFPTEDKQVMGCPHCKQSISIPAAGKATPMRWILGKAHPMFDNLMVIRMFLVEDRGGVEVYSVTADRQTAVRHFIPNASVLLTEEGMPMEIFIDELWDAEGVGEEPDPDPQPQPAPAPNGQNPS